MDTRPSMSYYQVISAMGKEAMWEKKANGETMHLAPLGYVNTRSQGRSALAPDPNMQRYIITAHGMRRKGYSLRRIAQILGKKGLRSKRGNIMGPVGIQRMLTANLGYQTV